MFRVPARPTYSGATAPPRLAYGSRRRLVGVMYGRNGWQPNGQATSNTASNDDGTPFPAPWGELEHPIPSVTVTTQLFPLEWWTAPGLRRTAVARATADPIELLARRSSIPILPEPRPLVAEATEPDVGAPLAIEPTDRPAPREWPEHGARRTRSTTRRSAHQRRGLVTRMALVAIGLILSLIAVETATRRRP